MNELIRLFVLKLFFPFIIHGGKLVGADRDKSFAALIKLNNYIVLKIVKKKKLTRTMLLIPHCLQNYDCELKLTSDILKCKRCGKCDIEKLASLSEKYNLSVHIASGGTSALHTARAAKPQVITAVACGRDLISGIRDIYPIPTIGVQNRRTEIPCRNTRLNVDDVEDVLKMLRAFED